MVWWESLLICIALIASAIISRVIIRDRPIIPKSRATLRADLEILKLLESTDENYQIVKANVDSSIRSIYQIRGKRTLRERSRVYDRAGLIVGIIFLGGFGWWTIYLVMGGSWWAILAILTGFFTLVGLVSISNAFNEPRGEAPESAYNTAREEVQNAVIGYAAKHEGKLPPSVGTVTLIDPAGTYDIIDICSIIGRGKLLRKVPEGINKSNCGAGSCTCPDGNYIWLMESNGNVYSTCVSAECKAPNKDGFQGVWP